VDLRGRDDRGRGDGESLVRRPRHLHRHADRDGYCRFREHPEQDVDGEFPKTAWWPARPVARPVKAEDCSETSAAGTVVTLTTPRSGWSEGGCGTQPCTITLTADASVPTTITQ
jgi:hypothetical protein